MTTKKTATKDKKTSQATADDFDDESEETPDDDLDQTHDIDEDSDDDLDVDNAEKTAKAEEKE